MHIKQVIIRGFKTYKEQTSLTEDFSKHVNVVVGFNGSGKSNFFNAILFVISDHFGTLRAEMRKSLLHEGAGTAVATAFVELVFDNGDRRMPIDKDEVRIRRTIGTKKDDYSLDGKHATKQEVFNLLESCGFTKSNPYYIVQQGKVAELTLMSEARRLDLIKEVSGASVYDSRRAESLRVLEDMGARRKKTDDVISGISTRIKALEEEQRELVEYQKLEKQRKCLEYELTDREFRKAQERIEELEAKTRDTAAKLYEAQREVATVRTRVGEAEAELQQDTTKRERLLARREQAERNRGNKLEVVTRARLELDDAKKRAQAAKQSRELAQKEMQKLEQEAKEEEKNLKDDRPGLAAQEERRRVIDQRKHVSEAERDQLLAKQGRKTQYTSLQARNKALAEEIVRRKQRREKSAKGLQDAQAEIDKLERKAQEFSQTAASKKKEMQKLEQDIAKGIAPELAQVARELETVSEKRRIAAQDRDRKAREKDEAEREAQRCKERIEGTMPRPMRNAVTEVKRWALSQGLQDRVYGTLLDVIAVPDTYWRAAENTAGTALFNLLVADDDVAAQIVTLVRKNNLGNIVCTPLNQISVRRREYPQLAGAKPLVEVVRTADFAQPAVHQVFGKAVVCKSLELCDEVSRKYGLDAITLEGDKVSSSGMMTGGYQDPARFVRLSFATKMRQAKGIADRLAPQVRSLEEQVQQFQETLENIHNKRRDLQDRRGRARASLGQAAEQVQDAEAQAARHAEASRRYKERCDELQALIAECDATITALEAEAKTTALGELTPAEAKQLTTLTAEVKRLEQELEDCDKEVRERRSATKSKEQHLQDFLRRRLNELRGSLLKDSQQDHDEQLDEKSAALERAERELNEFKAVHDEVSQELTALEAALGERKAAQDELLNQEQQQKSNADKLTVTLDELTTQTNQQAKKRSEADEKLRGLTVTSSELPKYQKMAFNALMNELQKVLKQLSQPKFENVNKKAIDQFSTFMDQLQELERKRTELDDSLAAIKDFMKKVDEQKEETLLKTLQEVNKHFSSIFAELVRGGVGKIRMLQAGDQAEGDEDADGAPGFIAKGVRIEVSFTGQSTSFLTMGALSGGQKTVVAIALLFALQRLEPAPFYLFDEIDAALDTQYRTAIAQLIARDAKAGAQMVITTFRPEIIAEADRFYRVYQKDRVSRIECVSQKDAKRVIEEQTRLEGLDA
eukprot:TRINITY_DN24279_c0_g1_i1.p1 TRINITY_DN24279_c0_g1~~TRINITY_DN24279_c0_g1_i1.p1  ORF type:complete len:1203 (-),score=481.65 TRINITY_DN24279_c0_g1_i1:342-3950(-)